MCGQTYGLELHHCIHGSGRRKLADEDGLTVYLCHVCHRNLHDHGFFDTDLKMVAQTQWQKHYNKTAEDFLKRYHKSYLL